MRGDRAQPYPALAASVLLHASVLAAGLIAWPWLSKPIRMGDVTTVTLVTSAEVANLRAAIKAPSPTEAATETPVPQAPPQATPPAAAEPAKPTPTKSPTAKPEPTENFDALAASLAHGAKSSSARPSSAPRGPTRQQTATQASSGSGGGATASPSDLANLQAELMRLWNPNCDVIGGSDVNIVVTFTLDSRGAVKGRITSTADESQVPMIVAAVDRAKAAVGRASPYSSLPRTLYGTPIHVNFNAKKACAL